MTEKINPADAIRLLDAHEAVAVDVREPDEYAVGHIPGAKLLPLAAAAPTRCRSWRAWAIPICGTWAAS